MSLQEIKTEIEKHEVISFDVFSTLIDRPYVRPIDLFKQIEVDLNLSGFYRERVDAERRSRRRGNPEINYNDIYEEIDKNFFHIKETELDYEMSLLKANSEMKEVFDYAKSLGKSVIIASDMYLSSDFLNEVLKKNGYFGYSKIYVSCEYKRNKHSGELFKLILKDLNISPASMLHIGDNKHSDYDSARCVGIDAVWYESVISQYFSKNKSEFKVYNRNKDLGVSILTSMDALKWLKNGKCEQKENYWLDVSYRFAGPVVYSFLKFIKQNLPDNVKIFFVARDGYNLIRVFRILYGDSATLEYVYAPRIFRYLAGYDNKDDPDYAYWIVRYFADHNEVRDSIPNVRLTTKACVDIYRNNTEIFENLRTSEMEKCDGYMKKILVGNDDIAMVDATTMRYSSQKLIEHYARDRNVIGYYYNALKDSKELKHFKFQDRTHNFISWSEVNVPELFMSSPEPPIRGISEDYRPLFKEDNSEHELYRISIHEDILRGETDYAVDMVERFGDKIPDISADAVAAWTNMLIHRRSNADKENILKMKWAPDFDHKEHYYLILNWADLGHHVKGLAISMIKKVLRK